MAVAEAPRTRVLPSLARNSLAIIATSAVNALLGYGYWTLAARIMPTSAVGLGSAATSALVLVSLAVHLGAGAGLIARLPKRASREEWLLTVVSTLAATSAVTLLVAAVAVVPLGLAVPPLRVLTADPAFAIWFVLGAVGWTGSGVLDYLFIAERRSDLMLARNASTAVAKLAGLGAVALLWPGSGPLGLVATWSLSGLLGTAVGLVLCHRRIRPLGRVPLAELPGELASLVRPALGHHAISVGGLIPTYLLPIVVTARLGATDNAHFYVTWMVGSAIFMISPAVSSALFAEGSHDQADLRRVAGRTLLITLAAISAPSVVLFFIGRPVLGLFGGGYGSGFALLVVLILSAFPDAVSNVAVAVLRVRGLLSTAAALNGLIATVAVSGAWLAAPSLGIRGAGIAWLSAQLAGALAVLAFRRRLLPA